MINMYYIPSRADDEINNAFRNRLRKRLVR